MAVDTRDKRASVVGLFTPLPLPDGTVGDADRIQVSWVYAGIVAEAPAPPVTDEGHGGGWGEGILGRGRQPRRPIPRLLVEPVRRTQVVRLTVTATGTWRLIVTRQQTRTAALATSARAAIHAEHVETVNAVGRTKTYERRHTREFDARRHRNNAIAERTGEQLLN